MAAFRYMDAGFKYTLGLSGILLLLCCWLVALLVHSPLLHDLPASMHIDSQAYVYAAQRVLGGDVLYKDVFDHKGPFLYVLQCLGLALTPGSLLGVWWLQLFFLVACMFPLFYYWHQKIAPLLNAGAILLCAGWMSRCMQIGDNIPELYAMALFALYLASWLHVRSGYTKIKLHALLMGFSATAMLLLKANFFILCLPLYVILFSKKTSYDFKFLSWHFTGVFLVVLPILAYFIFHRATAEALFAVWTFNFHYVQAQPLDFFQSLYEVLILPRNMVLLFVMCCSLIAACLNQTVRNQLLLPGLIFILSVMVLAGLPGRGAESLHYLMPTGIVLVWMLVIAAQHAPRSILTAVLLCCLFFCKPVVLDLIQKEKKAVHTLPVADHLIQYKKTGESLAVWGNQSALYLLSGMKSNTPWFYTYPILLPCGSDMHQTYQAAFSQNRSSWIACEKKQDGLFNCLQELKDGYVLVYEDADWQLWHQDSQ